MANIQNSVSAPAGMLAFLSSAQKRTCALARVCPGELMQETRLSLRKAVCQE